MAIFRSVVTLAAGATVSMLEQAGNNWKYNRLPYDCLVEVMAVATGVNVLERVTSGSDEIVQESPIGANGVAGTLPSRLNFEPVTWHGKAGDLIQANYRNADAAARTVNFQIEITRTGKS